jgi:23S rRNA pseudouridine2605 synthase
MTNDGHLANELTHPSYQKQKVYLVELDKPLSPEDAKKIEEWSNFRRRLKPA